MHKISIPPRLLLLLLPGLIFLLICCRKPRYMYYPVFYDVANHAGTDIKVVFNDIPTSYCPEQKVEDSIIYISPGDEKTLFIATHDYGPANPEKDQTLSGMGTLRIYILDTIQSTTDFLQTQYWSYREISKTRGELRLDVNDSDFNIQTVK